ncbi:hypothetical protein COY23_01885 [bacterium (Candidatus Torokbacteria) CG_4_10_14_0_2_um_filter_35_8]|nr:MAG: hypothetical protein COY23_01885 [bacterium (Candidatus Torokbacteria) CG_4_10_14_0_2_um_filter_35_8]
MENNKKDTNQKEDFGFLEKKETKKVKKEKEPKKKRNIVGILFFAFCIVALITVIVTGAGLYKLGWDNKYTDIMKKALPYPVALVNFRLVTFANFKDSMDSVTKIYEENENMDFSSDEGKKIWSSLNAMVLKRMIEDEIVRELCLKKDVLVTDEDIDKELEMIVEATGDKALVEEKINEIYGWTLDEFKQKILIPSLRRKKLEEKVLEDEEVIGEAREEAEKVLEEIKKGEASFSELAQKYSEDNYSAENGGDLGWFSKGDMIKEFEDAAFSLEKGEVSNLVKTKYGFHIIEVTDRNDKEEKIKASHILIRTDFQEWLSGQIDETFISVFLSGFWWNKESKEVDFEGKDTLEVPTL